tara:strand:+ start:837 stop:1754 length:918 start_codon:yes stop_codon:yes gene_type:complete
MIVPDQKNIKIHFAGGENLIRSNLILKGAKANYSLFTIFPFLCNHFGIKHGYQNKGQTYEEVSQNNFENSKHCIQDSGLFSLMFGSYQGKCDEKFISKWYEALVETTKNGKFKGSVVEVDCQKVLGVDKAWEFREKMKTDLPNNRHINVFHKEDGKKGLDRLIEFSDYIAISVPELRAMKQKHYTEDLAHYIKNKKPSIDIHLLGCTENKMLKNLDFCSSCDSTSWVSFNKYGWFKYNDGSTTTTIKKSNVNIKTLEKIYYSRLEKLMDHARAKKTPSLKYYHACDLMQLDYLLKQYTYYAGPQN